MSVKPLKTISKGAKGKGQNKNACSRLVVGGRGGRGLSSDVLSRGVLGVSC